MSAFPPDSPLVSRVAPSPNHGERQGVAAPDSLILHYTGLRQADAEAWLSDPGGAALSWLRDPLSEVSSHYVVEPDGRILQLVPEARRAWHAGRSAWRGRADMNTCSIGVEIVNLGHSGGLPAFPDAQIAALVALCRDICGRWSIAPERVLGHSDVAPDRKLDPGERFPWQALAAAGVGHWRPPATAGAGRAYGPGDEGQPVRALQAMFALYGYHIPLTGVYDEATVNVVTAFQRHFRQAQVDGVADPQTIATLRDLIAALRGSEAQGAYA
ncbi:MAG TPA: N-acetylmuramoyl-L-alanine amidase [Beijerinckiaceae bacterium]|jgi:N-acetylmuramoyl-L-alanine amidase